MINYLSLSIWSKLQLIALSKWRQPNLYWDPQILFSSDLLDAAGASLFLGATTVCCRYTHSLHIANSVGMLNLITRENQTKSDINKPMCPHSLQIFQYLWMNNQQNLIKGSQIRVWKPVKFFFLIRKARRGH